MPGATWEYSRKTGTWVVGLWQENSDEVDAQAPAFLLDALYDAWPWPAFWMQLRVTRLWSEFRPDKPQYFRDKPLTSGLYTWTDNTIDLHNPQFLMDKAGVLAHEVGHMMQDVYRLGSEHDTLGGLLWQAQCTVAENSSIEEFASNVGRILLRRLRVRHEMVPPGFENFLEYVRQVRS